MNLWGNRQIENMGHSTRKLAQTLKRVNVIGENDGGPPKWRETQETGKQNRMCEHLLASGWKEQLWKTFWGQLGKLECGQGII